MPNKHTEFKSLEDALYYIEDHHILERLTNDVSVVTDIISDYLLKQAVKNTPNGRSLLSNAKNNIKSAKRPSRRPRQPLRYDPYRSDHGSRWIKGSGSAIFRDSNLDPTDRYDWDMYGDGGPESISDHEYDPNESSEHELSNHEPSINSKYDMSLNNDISLDNDDDDNDDNQI